MTLLPWRGAIRRAVYVTVVAAGLASGTGAFAVDSSQLEGQVVDSATREPLEGSTVTVNDRFAGAVCDTDGRFTIRRLGPGVYVLRISHIGHATRTIDSVIIPLSGQLDITVALVPHPVELKGLVVHPGSYSLMGDAPIATQTMTSREIQTKPQLGDDFFRAINRLPGMTGNDFSTRFAIRGGEFNEVLVRLDGLLLTEPFHLKDVDGGAMSIIDVAAVDGIELITGGFPAEYGNKMSGVLDITSRRVPAGKSRVSASVSLLNARALAEGSFDDARGSWLASVRRGYIDLVLKMAGADDRIRPTYYDAYGKVQYRIDKRHVLAAHLLHARDQLQFKGDQEDTGDTLLTKYGSSYGWLTLWSQLHSRLSHQLMVAAGTSDHDRRGQTCNNNVMTLSARDHRSAEFWNVKSDMEWDASRRLIFKWGGEYERRRADYRYSCRNFYYGWRVDSSGVSLYLDRIDSLDSRPGSSDTRLSGYVSSRTLLARPLAMELGVRYDRLLHSADHLISPRACLAYQVGDKTTVRAAWGFYYQPEGIDEIAVQDGETTRFGAQKAEHWVLGLDRRFTTGTNLKLEVYQKKYSHLRPAYRNTFETIELFPEREEDRTAIYRAESSCRGLEMLLKRDVGTKVSWWLSYAYARAEDSVRYIVFRAEQDTAYYGAVIPIPQDQRHTLCLDLYYRPSPRWQLSTTLQYHSGWPRTDVYLESTDTPVGRVYWLESASQWAARFDPYARIDCRVDRYFPVGSGRIAVFVQLLNVLNRENIRNYNYSIVSTGNTVAVERDPEHWLGRLPSFGISYEVVF